jgi:hypothetical protein
MRCVGGGIVSCGGTALTLTSRRISLPLHRVLSTIRSLSRILSLYLNKQKVV